ncbi:hypothetical protein [Actinoplanes solisilvae]|uniref:hypothetical protein n=1 Tax=Actinoplanes solisilvae TaxID=2486853 RepID=UPI0013E28E4A|nr:hypothetical protein [Actinoplanes solisilvae]
MKELLQLARELAADDVGELGPEQLRELTRDFIEVLTFAPAEEIVSMLRISRDENYLGLPVWARNLAFRLACLQRPGDAALLRDAGRDLMMFGPDWDDIATSMLHRADAMEAADRD